MAIRRTGRWLGRLLREERRELRRVFILPPCPVKHEGEPARYRGLHRLVRQPGNPRIGVIHRLPQHVHCRTVRESPPRGQIGGVDEVDQRIGNIGERVPGGVGIPAECLLIEGLNQHQQPVTAFRVLPHDIEIHRLLLRYPGYSCVGRNACLFTVILSDRRPGLRIGSGDASGRSTPIRRKALWRHAAATTKDVPGSVEP